MTTNLSLSSLKWARIAHAENNFVTNAIGIVFETDVFIFVENEPNLNMAKIFHPKFGVCYITCKNKDIIINC